MFSFFLTHQVEASPRGTGSLTLFSYFFNGICLLFNKNFALRIEAGLPLFDCGVVNGRRLLATGTERRTPLQQL